MITRCLKPTYNKPAALRNTDVLNLTARNYRLAIKNINIKEVCVFLWSCVKCVHRLYVIRFLSMSVLHPLKHVMDSSVQRQSTANRSSEVPHANINLFLNATWIESVLPKR